MKAKSLTFALTAFLLVFSSFLSAGELNLKAGPAEPVLTFSLPDDIGQDDIVKAVKFALTRREWRDIEFTDNTVTASLIHRRRDANLKFIVEGNEVTVYSDSWVLKKDGTRKSREHPAGWINNLEKDIHKAVAQTYLNP